jgi:membrane-associated PAP2 superfamily phosphatase
MIWQYTAPLAHCSTLVKFNPSNPFTQLMSSFLPTKNAGSIIPTVLAIAEFYVVVALRYVRRRRAVSSVN